MKRLSFLATFIFSALVAGICFAAEGGATAVTGSTALAKAILMGVASGMGALGQSRAAAAALEGIARNPQAQSKVQTPMILSFAFMESLVIFSLIVSFTM